MDGVAFEGGYSNGADANGANDLGSTTNQWRDIYLSGDITSSGGGATFAGNVNIDGSPVVSGDTRAVLTIDENNTASAGRGGGLTFGRQGFRYGGIKTLQNTSSNDNATMYFQTIGAGSISNRMVIDELGNVGIGTVSPSKKLHVVSTAEAALFQGSATWGTAIQINATATGGRIFQLQSTANSDGSGGGNFLIVDKGTTAAPTALSRLIIDSSGNVGINDTSPSYRLDVDGTIRATSDVIAFSDRRVKENIVTIDNALDKVTKLRGVTYTRKDIEDKSTKVGVIAQEVLEVLPEVVSEDKDGKYSVAYGNLAGVFIEAIKELENRIKELENKSCNCKCK